MPWILVDILIALLALVLLGLVSLRTYRRAKLLAKTAGQTASALESASDRISELQDARPVPSRPTGQPR